MESKRLRMKSTTSKEMTLEIACSTKDVFGFRKRNKTTMEPFPKTI